MDIEAEVQEYRALEPEQKIEKMTRLYEESTPAERKAISAGRIDASEQTRDRLYMIVVIAFSVVLVGAFVTLAVGVFVAPGKSKVSPELILTTFTTVVGFLAGLFAPSPGADR